MQSTVQQRLTNLIRGGMAFTLATTLMVPAAALAQPASASADADAVAQENEENVAEDSSQNGYSDSSATASSTDPMGLFAANESASTVVSAASSATATDNTADETPALDVDGTADQVGDGNEKVTIIVQLEDGGTQGVSLLSTLFGRQKQDRHAYFKEKVRDIAAGETADEAENGGISLMALADAISGAASQAEDTSVDELHDYYNVLDGFAVKAPAKTLEEIKNLDGVKNAFVEHMYSVSADQQDSGLELKNQASLDITQADDVEQKGDGQVIAIIDTGIDTDHEAFSGDLDDSKVALTQGSAAQARSTMKSGGQNGAYVSEKIPFAYDYADGDAEVNPGISGLEHGTHVAGIASANGGDQIRGTAPNAQLAIMKVASDSTGGIYDSALIAAMDDIPALGASSVNISIGADAGFSDEGAGTYTDAINNLESKGITVNVAAGNSYSASKYGTGENGLPYATDPDSSIVSTPATVSGSFAVASMNTDKVEVEDTATYITASNGEKMQYWEALDPNGDARPNKFADLADGSYDVVWGDIGRVPSMCGDVSGENGCLAGKVVLVRGHGDFYGSEQSYARVCATMSGLGAAAVVFYDPNLSDADLANVRLGGGADDTDANWGSSWYDANSCPAIFVTAEAGEKLKAIAADARAITKSSPAAAMSAFLTADGTKVAYQQLGGTDTLTVPKFSDLADGDYEYVWGGIGRNDYEYDEDGDASEVDVSGKIVLMEGHGVWPVTEMAISYDRAIDFYQGKGAKAIIFYNAEIGDDLAQKQQLDNDGWLSGSASIPCAIISQTDALALKEKSRSAATKTGTITIKAGTETGGEASTKSYYAMSSYSSWGVTPDLKLKPEIAAPGGNVYSSVLNNQYAYYSGTSMATPQITGVASLIHEYVSTDSKFANLSATAKAQVVTQLLMSTASPMVDPRDDSSYYTPRQQGAGIANAVAATTTDVYATVDGATDASRPKADLGESANGQWSFTITLHNVGSQARSFAPDTAALSDTVANGLFQQQMKNWTGAGIDVSYAGDAYSAESGNVTVPANGIANLTVTVSCGADFAAFANDNTPNGTFVDGFAMLKSTDNGVDLSVPFMGFYGDWSKASVFDAAASDDYHLVGTKMVDAIYGQDLGVNPLVSDAEKKFDMNRIVVSNSGFSDAPTTLTTSTSMLRNVNNLTYSMTGPDGSDEGSASYDYVRKTYYNATYGMWAKAEDLMDSAPVFYPGNDSEAAEGVYTLTETATTAGPTPEQQSQEFQIHYDTTAPEITDVAYDDNDGDPTLTFTVKDNTYVAAIDLVAPDEQGITPYKYFYRAATTADPVAQDADGNNIFEVQVKIADVKAAWPSKYGSEKEIANTVRAYAWDYGKLVSQSATAVVNPVAATSVKASAESVSVAPGQTMPLSATLTPADTTDTELTWTSSDEGVATVAADGTLTGVAEGEAEVTVAVKNNPSLTDTVKVKVAEVSADRGVVLSADNLRSIKDGDAVRLTALLSTDMEGASLTWETSDANVFSVAAVDGQPTMADVQGGYQVGDATVTVTATKDGVTKTAEATVQNRTADYDDFIIDENHVLRGYTGNQTTILIPNDVTEIGDGAFEGDMQLSRVGVPASVKRIGERAFAPIVNNSGNSWSKVGTSKQFSFESTEAHPSQLTEIAPRAFADGGVSGYLVLPEGLTTIGESAFDSNLGMSGVYIPDSVRSIANYAFQQTAIEVVEMSDNVESIGVNAFKNNLFLTQIKLHHTAKGAADNGLPSHLTELADGAFSGTYLGAEGASDLVVPGTVKHLGQGVFSGDRYITSVTLCDGVESIGYGCFAGCMGLTSFTMPDSVTSIEDQLFQDCEYLKEVTVSRNLAAGDLAGTFSWCFSLESVNIPTDAANYTARDGVVYSKDMSTLVYCPTAKTGTLEIPEGVTSISYDAFESSSLDNVVFPNSLQTIETNGFAKQLDVVDLGGSVVEVHSDAFRQHFYADDANNKGYTPAHLIVRGGNSGSYADTKYASSQQTAYFGEGMTSLEFSQSGAPGVLVVPASLTSLDLSGNVANPASVTVYAPANSNGYNVAKAALEAIGADPDKQLKEYSPLTATLKLGGIPEDGVYPLVAEASGGVEGAKEYRFVQQNADGDEAVLSDWSSTSVINWKAPADGTTVRAEVRDATYLTADAGTYGVAVPVITADLDAAPVTVQPGGAMPSFAIGATATDGAQLSYQWYVDDVAVEGATAASFTPSLAAGTHTVHVAVKATAGGMTAVAKSQVATVNVLAAAQVPTITANLDAQCSVNLGDAFTLKVEASSPDGGTLAYQWYRDGKAIDGAVAPSLSMSADAVGSHTYYVVVSNTVNGSTATAQSITCTVTAVNPNAADTSALSALVERAEALNESQYTAETWAPFAAALSDARGVLASQDATQAEVDAARSALQQAMDDLVKKATSEYDRTKLADGVYDISVSFRNASNVSSESMMGAVVDKTSGKLVVKDGKYTVQFNAQTMSVMGVSADLTSLQHYPGGYVSNGAGMFQGNTVDCETSGTYTGADGAEHALTYYVPLSDAAIADGYVCMYAHSTYMDAQVVLGLDWAEFDAKYDGREVAVKDALNEQIEAAQAVASSDSLDYTLLKQAIDAALAVAADENATQAQVDAQAKALSDALKVYNGQSLTEVADGQTWRMDSRLLNKDGSESSSSKYFSDGALVKRVGDGYEVSITTMAAYDQYIAGMTYGDDTVAAVADNGDGTHTYTFVTDSLTRALKVAYAIGSADGTTVSMYLVLDTGAATLVDPGTADVSKADLQTKVDQAKGLIESDYTPESWEPFAKALAKAQLMLENSNATQAEVDAALAELAKAESELVKAESPTVDKSELETGLQNAKDAVAKLNESDYTEESWRALQDAMADAQAVLDDPDATQEQVEVATTKLTAAYQGLAKADASSNGDNGDGGNADGNGNDTGKASGAAASGNAGNSASGASSSASGSTAKTGDMAPVAPIVGGGLIAALGAVISATALRLRKRNR